MYKNRSNRPKKDLPRLQGYKELDGTTHKPLNNHQPRAGTKSKRRKCHCEFCGGNKNNKIGEQEDKKFNWKEYLDID